MNVIRTDYTEPRGGRVNEWESILGRLDAVAGEINRALGRVTSIEEPGSENFLISFTGFGTFVDAKGEMNQTDRTARETVMSGQNAVLKPRLCCKTS